MKTVINTILNLAPFAFAVLFLANNFNVTGVLVSLFIVLVHTTNLIQAKIIAVQQEILVNREESYKQLLEYIRTKELV